MRTIINVSVRLLAAGLLALLLSPALVAAGGISYAAYTVTTNADVNKIWRKSQGKLAMGYNFKTKEFRWVKDFKELEIDASLREMTFPVKIYEDRGIASIPEGGKRAQPMTQNAEDATVQFIHLDGRFTVSFLAHWASLADGGRGEIKKQLKWEGMNKVEAMARVISDQFYGFSTGIYAQATAGQGSAASHTITLKNIFGSATWPATTTAQKNYITNLFKVGDQVGLTQAAASTTLVTNGIGTITAVTPATPSIAVTWIPGNVAITTNDFVQLANSSGQSTVAHTDNAKHLVGLLDAATSASVHGIAASGVPNWAAAINNSDGGRFNGIRWRSAVDEMEQYGDEDAKIVTLMAPGVYRDTLAQYQTQLQFSDAFSLEVDGDIKMGGQKPRVSRRVPPGTVIMFDASRAIRKKTIFDNVDEDSIVWKDGYEMQDDSGMIFGIQWAGFLAYTNRKLLSLFSGLTEQ